MNTDVMTRQNRTEGKWRIVFFLFICFAAELLSAGMSNGSDGEQTDFDLSQITVLDLETAQRIAVSEHPNLAAASERVFQAKERVVQVAASYYPTLDITASLSHVGTSESDRQKNLATLKMFDPNADVDAYEDYYRTALTASYVLFDGFRRKFTRAEAVFGKQRAMAARDEAERLLRASVAEAFFNVQLAKETIRIAKADELYNRKLSEEARIRFEAGSGSQSDILNFDILVNSAVSNRLAAERDFEISRTGLASLMNLPNGILPEHIELVRLETERKEEMESPDAKYFISYADTHRPDLQMNRYALNQAESTLESARSNYYPIVSVSASVQGERSNDPGFDQDDFGNSVGLYFSWNLFSGGAHRAQTAGLFHAKKEAAANLDASKIRVTEEILKAVSGIQSAQKTVRIQRSTQSLVKRNRDLVEEEYRAGTASLVRLNEAQRNLVQAEGRLAQSLIALRKAWVNLNTASGRM